MGSNEGIAMSFSTQNLYKQNFDSKKLLGVV